MSNFTYQSGAAKRKKASKVKEDLSKFLTLTSFLLVQKSKPVVLKDLFLCPSTSLISTENNNKSTSLPNEAPVIQQELEPEHGQERGPEHRLEHGPEQEPEPEWEPESNQQKTNSNTKPKTKTHQETDPALWYKLSQESQSFWSSNGPSICQNNGGSFKNLERSSYGQKRYLSKSCFSRELHNGEFVNREWLLYSPSTGSVFCFACTLFSSTHSNFSTSGLDDWKNASKCISGHENGPKHHKNMLTYSSWQKGSSQLDSILVLRAKKKRINDKSESALFIPCAGHF